MALLNTLIVVLMALILAYLVISSVIQYRRLKQFKGPWLACLTPLWLFKCTAQGKMYLACADAIEKYGSPARIAPNKIITDDPAIFRAMSAPRSPFTRGTWYTGLAMDPRASNVLSETNEKAHNELRAKLICGYSGKDLPHLEADTNTQILNLLSLISQYAKSGKPMDLAVVIQYFTLDVLTKIAFASPFGFLTKNEDVYDYLKMTSAYLPILELGCNFPTIHSLLFSPLMQRLFAPKGTDMVGVGALIGVARTVIAHRYTPEEKTKPEYNDMLASSIRNGLTQLEAESEAILQVMAGSDSTATAIRATLLFVLTNPRVHAKLIAEITANPPMDGAIISSAEARKLPYLQAVIKEGLRIFPPLGGLASKLSPEGGVIVRTSKGEDLFIPGGVEVGESRVRLCSRMDVFGQDARVFRPERWLEAEAELETDGTGDAGKRYMQMERCLESVFGTGRYGCLGKNIALMELDKVIVAVLGEFEMSVVDPISPMRTRCWGIHVQKGFWVSVKVMERERGI